MKHDDDRIFALAKPAHQVVGHARANGRDDAHEKIEHRDPRIEPLDHKHAREGDPVKEPLPRRHRFAQNKDADERGKDGRQILDRDRGGEMHVLQGDEKSEEGERPEGAASNQKGVIVAFPIEPPPRDFDATDQARDKTAEKDDLHCRDTIELLDEDVHRREGQCRQEHVPHPTAQAARSARRAFGQPMHAGSSTPVVIENKIVNVPHR